VSAARHASRVKWIFLPPYEQCPLMHSLRSTDLANVQEGRSFLLDRRRD
jgi:hypothetical protein